MEIDWNQSNFNSKSKFSKEEAAAAAAAENNKPSSASVWAGRKRFRAGRRKWQPSSLSSATPWG